MSRLNEVARDLLASGRVEAVIGFESVGADRTRPLIARTAEQADKLVFDHSCVNNLAVYLTRQKRPAEKVAVVAKGCDARAVAMLVQEQQVVRENVFVIGVECDGVVRDSGLAWSEENAAAKCSACKVMTPALYDELVGEKSKAVPRPNTNIQRVEELKAQSADARFDFWEEEFDRCIRCHACRQVCPMCYCDQCIADKSIPRWIESSATPRANMAWNMIRAFHQAGRCVGCGECERACPAGIPLGLLNMTLGMAAGQEFGYHAGMDPNAPTLVGTYDNADREDFIK